ncbi:MAG: 23S rRNA pseudouridine synthase F [Flavobacteriaceae bacterium]|nr:23S rRNA pseudouridine synthase F [Flavobacteriaceae bacterium]|tara:strand:- start:6353 stop:7063 length:711 start_codon:yes stop_codon:yes gene_type:complete
MKIRLNKYLSEVGHCSRRNADKLIKEGKVTVNNIIAELGAKVVDDDQIVVEGTLIKKNQAKMVYMALNKPKGIVCTTDKSVEKNNIISFINYHKRIFPIGRLDKNTEGLILLTNDGDIVNKILRSKNNNEKEYEVSVNKNLTNDFVQKMSSGIPILGTLTKKCSVKKIKKNKFKIILTQGLNRQIRRMCNYLDYKVTNLKRIRIMNIKLDTSPGKWRYLTQNELEDLNSLLQKSSK